MPPTNEKPSAPRLELLEHHYGSEVGCDVVFLVGPSQDNCLRIPAHSHILKEATPVFAAMFSSNFFHQCNQEKEPPSEGDQSSVTRTTKVSSSETSAEDQQKLIPFQIPVPDLDGKAFDNLMKYTIPYYEMTHLSCRLSKPKWRF